MTSPAPTTRLIAVPVPTDFEGHRDVALAPWCFAGNEERFPDWESHPFVDPFGSTEALADVNGQVADLAESLTAALIPKLNRDNGVNRSDAFWYLLVTRWALELAQATYFHFRCAQAVLTKYPEASVALVTTEHVDWNFRCTADYYRRGVCSVRFHAWLAGLALRRLAPPSLRIIEHPLDPGQPSEYARPAVSELIRRRLHGRAAFGVLLTEHSLRTKIASVMAHCALDLWLRIIPRKRVIHHATADPDAAKNTTLPPAFIALFNHVLAAAPLATVGPDFARFHATAARIRPRPGRLSVVAPGVHYDEEHLFELAARIDGGEGLVYVQHGSNYGASKVYSLAERVEYRQHAFLTWGWTRHPGHRGRLVPAPTPVLANWIGTYRPGGNRLIMVARDIPFAPRRIDSVGEIYAETEARRERMAFLDGLPGSLRACMSYRPYPESPSSLKDESLVRKTHPDVHICASAGEMLAEMKAGRLLVIDHPGTTLYIALASGLPFVGIWSDRVWPMAPDFREIFDELRELHVLFESGASAAAHVKTSWDSMEYWWSSHRIQAVLQRLRKLNGQSSRWWLPMWMRILLKIP
ncbi:LIC12162 family transferase [Magnetospirillum sp. ME-1]|uniref:LIC12162 family transferase n=1 Tax=Magnetospirillum sp. ME-1 TaxID=1639348 RepID=UPI000A198105|nr:LIC12162 family protein [Magnetospirillum sp. ME-1]